ncbi:unnamed protein product [Nezara viridula]|uniref:Uncharacterized protein n=1 Tax=Nezara viridula TaxID=85310 RepID=A0A9P0EEX1_NEZVI|nr:unnamed protein product [Nezara viridula]
MFFNFFKKVLRRNMKIQHSFIFLFVSIVILIFVHFIRKDNPT